MKEKSNISNKLLAVVYASREREKERPIASDA